MLESIQAWGFALRAATPQDDPTRRSIVFNRPFDDKLTTGRIHYSMFDVGRSMFDVHLFLFFDQTGRFLARGRAFMKHIL